MQKVNRYISKRYLHQGRVSKINIPNSTLKVLFQKKSEILAKRAEASSAEKVDEVVDNDIVDSDIVETPMLPTERVIETPIADDDIVVEGNDTKGNDTKGNDTKGDDTQGDDTQGDDIEETPIVTENDKVKDNTPKENAYTKRKKNNNKK